MSVGAAGLIEALADRDLEAAVDVARLGELLNRVVPQLSRHKTNGPHLGDEAADSRSGRPHPGAGTRRNTDLRPVDVCETLFNGLLNDVTNRTRDSADHAGHGHLNRHGSQSGARHRRADPEGEDANHRADHDRCDQPPHRSAR